jgi:tetratricopeptide (TPR) repeat protein
MREDIDFDIIDTYIEENLDALEWKTENPTIQFSFNLALESLRDHEIDRCVWTLKKAVETSKDGEGINHAIHQLLVCTELYPEALEVLGEAIEKEFEDPHIDYNYAYCLYEMNEIDKAEKLLAIQLEDEEDELSSYCLSLLANIRSKQGRNLEAKALHEETILSRARLGLPPSAIDGWNLSQVCERLNLIDEAIDAARSGQPINPLFRDWDARILELENRSTESDDEDEIELEDSSSEIKTYEEWFKAGSFWHADIPKDFFNGAREFLEELYQNGAAWSDESDLLFSDFWLEEDSLEESLARVESLSDQFRLQPTWPVYLETSDISIAMTINRNFLLAWVGVGLEGLLVGVNVKTWDIYHAEDTDARFAAGAVLNWFIDCSLDVATHEMFFRTPNRWREIERPWEPKYLTTWSTTNLFHEDIENIRRYEDRKPPRAHRVRGHIRTLTERQPTDEARENAPAYIRRNMGPTDTFVSSYTKSGELGVDKLLNHLKTRSSLADFLGTAPLFESD